MMHKRYTKEQCTAAEAQRLAQEIAFGPVVFQVSRLMLKFGIFQLLSGKREGYTLQEISGRTGLTRYAAQVLLEASLTIGTILLEEDRYVLAKAGWFLLNNKMARVNMEFNHDVNYQGLFHLEEALLNGRPEGLKVFGEWPTITKVCPNCRNRYRKAGSALIISIRTSHSAKRWKSCSAITRNACSILAGIPADGPHNAYNIIRKWK